MNRPIQTGLGALILLIAGYFIAAPLLAGSSVKKVLQTAGFSAASVTESQSVPGGRAFNGIHLDSKNLNTIQSALVRDDKDGKTLTLNKLVLTGDWEHTALPDIAGMTTPFDLIKLGGVLRAQNIKSILLNGGQIDLVLPLLGIVHLQAKGRLHLQDDGSLRLAVTLWSNQEQLTGQINVTGEFAPGGTASIDFEVVDGKIDLKSMIVSRMGGWVVFNKTDMAPWSISAQVVAGSARLYTLQMRGATLSVQGTTQTMALNLQSAGMESGTSLSVDATLSNYNKNTVTATILTNDLGHLVNGILSSTGPDTRAASKNRPSFGGTIAYHADSDKASSLLDNGKLTLSDPAGTPWLNGGLHKTQAGMDLDIQQALIRPFANVIGIEKLNTEGSVTGLLNLHGNNHGGVVIEEGLIRSATAGVLSLDSKTLSPQIISEPSNSLDLLKSFAYDHLEISLSSAEEGIDADIKLSGHPLLNLEQKPTQMKFHFEGEI